MPNSETYDTGQKSIKAQLWQAKPDTSYARHELSYAVKAEGPRRSEYDMVLETDLIPDTESLTVQLDRKFQDPSIKADKPIGQSDVLILHAGTSREAAYYLTRSVWKRIEFK